MALDIHSAFSGSASTDRLDSHKSLKDALVSVQADSTLHRFAELQRNSLQHQLEKVQAGSALDAAEGLEMGALARAGERDKLLSAMNAITLLNRARNWSRDIQEVMTSGSLTATKALSSAELLSEMLADAQATANKLGSTNAYASQLRKLVSAGQYSLSVLKEQEQTAATWESEEIIRLRAENVVLKDENKALRMQLEALGVEVESLTRCDEEREYLVIQQAATIASLESAVKQVGEIAAQGSIIPAEAAANLVAKFGDRAAATFNKNPGKCKWATQARVNSSGDFDPKGRSWSLEILMRLLRDRNPGAKFSDKEIQKIADADALQTKNQSTIAGMLNTASGR